MDEVRYARRVAGGPARHWSRVLIPVGLILIAAAAVVLVGLMPKSTPPAPPPQRLPANVQTWIVTAEPELADTFDLTAVVEPEAVVRVAAEVPGRIERFGTRSQELVWRGQGLPRGATIDEGQPVSAGDPIVCLNRELLQARFDREQAQFEYDQRELERIDRLYKSGSTSKTERDDARTRYEVSKATRDEAARELERATIAAPISGILNSLPMEVGEYATPGDCVAEIVDIDRVKIVVNVPERDVYYLKIGDVVDVLARTPEQRQLTGEITYISELADEQTRTTRVEIAIDNPDHLLRSGQIVKARLTRRVLQDVIMIPLLSVIPLEEGRVVYVVDDQGLAQRRDVELGFIKGRRVQITRGVDVGDELIVSGHRYVGPGQPVHVVAEVNLEP